MDRKDLLLLVVAAGEGSPLEPVQLQKALFLIGKAGLHEVPEQFYEFEPYHYGPFDVNVYHDAEAVQVEGLVVRGPSAKGTWMDTAITPKGLEKASHLEKQLAPDSLGFIRDVVTWVRAQPFNSLVKRIYELFPEMRENSVFQG